MRNALTLVAVAVLSAAALTGSGGSTSDSRPSGPAEVGAGSTPEDVVRAYLAAVQEDDGPGAVSLTTAPYSERDPWAQDPPTIEDVQVGEHSADPSGPAATGRLRAVWVPVRFTLHGAGETAPDGPTSWGYRVVQDGGTDVWKIADAGW